jgi:phytoene dehydrogenase-like protein
MKPDARSGRTELSRRAFVGGAVALASGAAMPAGASAQSGGGIACRTTGCDYDVVVIGGGFAGVTTARDCQKNGYRTLVLEARDRLGGRTFTTEFEGSRIELGGTWIHNTQPFAWTEAERYGLEIKETPGAVPDVMQMVSRDGRRFNLTLEQSVEVAQGWDAYCAAAREIVPRPYDILHNREAARLPPLSLNTWT